MIEVEKVYKFMCDEPNCTKTAIVHANDVDEAVAAARSKKWCITKGRGNCYCKDHAIKHPRGKRVSE